MTGGPYATVLDPRKQTVLSSPFSFFFNLVFPVLCFSLGASLLVAGILVGGKVTLVSGDVIEEAESELDGEITLTCCGYTGPLKG